MANETEVQEPELPLETEVPPETATKDNPEKTPEEVEKENARQAEIDEHNKKLGVKPQEKKPKQGFQERIDELTKSFRSQERKAQELEKKLTELDADIDLLKKHNDEIISALKEAATEDNTKKTRKPAEETLANLRTQKKQALADVDYERAHEIQDQIDDLILAMSRPPAEEDIKKVAKKAGNEDRLEADVDAFCARNEWFLEILPDGKKNPKYDSIRAATAEGLEAKLLRTWKGSYGDLLKKVEEELKSRFDVVATPTPKPKVPAVQNAGGIQPGETPKIILSADQKRVISQLFPDDPDGEKKYMEQLALTQRRGA